MTLIALKLKNYFSSRGVAVYLALAFSALSLLLTFILVGVIEISATDSIKSRIGNSLAELATQTSETFDRGMFERYREVHLIASRDDLGMPAIDLPQRRQQLEALQESYPYYAWIGMTNIDGKVLVSTRKMLETTDVSQRPWFKNALNGIYLGDVHEAKLLAKLLPHSTGVANTVNNEPVRFVDIAFPYHDKNGQVSGILAAHLSWQWANDIEQSIVTPMEQRKNVESIIVDKDGKVLLGPTDLKGRTINPPSLKLAQNLGSGHTIETWPDNQRYLVGYSYSKGYQSYPGMGWTILVRQSEADAFSPLKKIQQKVIWTGLASAVLFSLLGLLVARNIILPLRALAKSAQRIQNGEIADIPASPSNNNYFEVQALTSSLNGLVGNLLKKESALKELNLTLEKRVEQRTAELGRALIKVTASETRIQSIIETAQAAFIGVDLHGNFIDWNTQAEKMFGWSRKEVIGKQMSRMILPARFQAIVDEAIEKVVRISELSGSGDSSALAKLNALSFLNHRMERIVLDRQNKEFPIEITISLVHNKDHFFFSAFLHDISDRKEVERMKNDFISTVSHELRTPLTSIRGSIGLLVGGVAGELPAPAKTLLEIASKNCARLVRLINDVLDIEKIESGNMRFDMVSQPLLTLAQHAIDATQGYAAQFNVNLVLQVAPEDIKIQVCADRDRLIQVLINLLSNAIKFSPENDTVTLRIAPHIHTLENWVRLSVIDHGCGIGIEFRQHIFQKFAMADSADSRKKGGTGLGLSISKNLVEQHGGHIGFFSAAGDPTEFFIDLPSLTELSSPDVPEAQTAVERQI
ncbi:sensor histidine kinase [Glaciimonas sp. PAMC28666]|uniref:sensor histidine kinase n=1 Tax=Glaciimonas sp. PAMC28666 TaxID=2807626 RepID=UPI0019639634|nr:sensor histidine kinase [Glaciimonas sp. PAMC28666]QRX83621.1 PAS domain S-box protein [Glaciimonas sp. PAMC28666]